MTYGKYIYLMCDLCRTKFFKVGCFSVADARIAAKKHGWRYIKHRALLMPEEYMMDVCPFCLEKESQG